jgi:hypothetical protein
MQDIFKVFSLKLLQNIKKGAILFVKNKILEKN